MPWTTANPPSVAKNWKDDEIARCVSAANAALKECDGGKSECDAKAIYACIRAAGKSEENSIVLEGLAHIMEMYAPPGDGGWPLLIPIDKSVGDVLVFPYGTYYRWGEPNEFTDEDGQEMIDNWAANLLERSNGWLPINEEHERMSGRIGYLSDLYDGGDGVRANYVVTNPEKFDKYDYLSPEIAWKWQHPFTGTFHQNVLMGAGATNYPYLLGRTRLRKDARGVSVYGPAGWQHFEKSGQVVRDVAFAMAHADQHIAYGAVFIPDTPDTDAHVLSAEEIEKAAHGFLEHLQLGQAEAAYMDAQHQDPVFSDQVRIVESWIQRHPVTWTFADREVEVPAGAWCMGVRFYDDDLWQQVLDGDITGFSPVGVGLLTPLADK